MAAKVKAFCGVIVVLNLTIASSATQCSKDNSTTVECNTRCCGDLPFQYCCPDPRKETTIVMAIIIASIMGVAITGAIICICAKRIAQWRTLTKPQADHGTTSNIVILFAGEIQDKTPLIKPNLDRLHPLTEPNPYCLRHLPIPRDQTTRAPNGSDVTKSRVPNISIINSNNLGNTRHHACVSTPRNSGRNSAWELTSASSTCSTGSIPAVSKDSGYSVTRGAQTVFSTDVFRTTSHSKPVTNAWASPDIGNQSENSLSVSKKRKTRKVKFSDRMVKTK